jgi:hypothetical protein
MKPASGQEISHYAPAEEFFNSLSQKRTLRHVLKHQTAAEDFCLKPQRS